MGNAIYRQYFLIFGSVVLMAVLWEFGGEEVFNTIFFGEDFETENTAEKIEFVLTISAFCFLALIVPFFIALHNEEKRAILNLDREKLIGELRKTLDEIKVLRGLLPVCSYCKKIRNDEGVWDMMEEYISGHSEVEFTHGVCPECFSRHMDETL